MDSLRVHEETAKSFAIERSDYDVLQERLESRYISMNQRYQELKGKEATTSSQLID